LPDIELKGGIVVISLRFNKALNTDRMTQDVSERDKNPETINNHKQNPEAAKTT